VREARKHAATLASNPVASVVALYLERTAKMATVANLPVAARTGSFALVHLRAAQTARRCVARFVSLRARSAVSQATVIKARSVLQTASVLPEAHPEGAVVLLVVPPVVPPVVPQGALVPA
jgi:hypothetical protein